MKELSIDEKSKRYEKALDEAKAIHKAIRKDLKPVIEQIFPELIETEDERIRREITDFIKRKFENSCSPTPSKTTLANWIAWLEKQSEKSQSESALETTNEEKVEFKYKDGDWIVYDNNAYKICNIALGISYECLGVDNTVRVYNHLIDNNSHLWTIEDAKDGDVLACNEELLLFKSYSVQKKQKRISLYCWYNGQTGNFHEKEVTDILLTTRNKVCPATKEQRDTLFQKMEEAGHEWDAENKVLKKL